jgi:chromosome segregation ATPase
MKTCRHRKASSKRRKISHKRRHSIKKGGAGNENKIREYENKIREYENKIREHENTIPQHERMLEQLPKELEGLLKKLDNLVKFGKNSPEDVPKLIKRIDDLHYSIFSHQMKLRDSPQILHALQAKLAEAKENLAQAKDKAKKEENDEAEANEYAAQWTV